MVLCLKIYACSLLGTVFFSEIAVPMDHLFRLDWPSQKVWTIYIYNFSLFMDFSLLKTKLNSKRARKHDIEIENNNNN